MVSGILLLSLNIEDWAGNYGIMPKGEHKNILEFASLTELIAFMQRKLVLRYQWSRQATPQCRVPTWVEVAYQREEPRGRAGRMGSGI